VSEAVASPVSSGPPAAAPSRVGGLPAPTRRAFWLLALVTLLAVMGFVTPWLGAAALAFDALVLVLVLVDGRRAARTGLQLQRSLPAVVHQGQAVELALCLATTATWPVSVALREVLGPRLTRAPADRALVVPARGEAELSLALVPLLRGSAVLPPAALRVQGPWGLAWAARQLDPGTVTRVYPPARLEGEAGLLLRRALERRTGANPLQRRGFSSELYALREYQPGDPTRSIHWKSSARRQRPVTREDTWEQHQHTLILVDCGRPMASLAGTWSKLDHTLAAVLALVRVIQVGGDSATLVLFSQQTRALVRVDHRTRGAAAVFEAVHAVQADLDEPDYGAIATWAARRVPRRSLALMCTSVVDLVGADLLAEALGALARRHHPLLVNLEDPGLVHHARSVPTTVEEAYAKTSALHLEHANLALTARLRGRGVDVVSAPADQLALRVLQRYLDLKARRRA